MDKQPTQWDRRGFLQIAGLGVASAIGTSIPSKAQPDTPSAPQPTADAKETPVDKGKPSAMRFLTVAAIHPRREPAILDDLLEMCKRSGTTDVAVYYMVLPDGEPLMQRSHDAKAQFLRIKDVLSPHGIRAGILLQTVIGHVDFRSPISPVDFQRITGWNGAVTQACFCPLDERFLDYVEENVRILTQAKPNFMLVDDDVRLGNHGIAHTCACDLHVKYFNEQTGRKLKREQIFEKMQRNDEQGRTVRRQWYETLNKSLLPLAERIRKAIDSVDPTIRCGKCISGGREMLHQEEIVRILAGKHRPMARLAGAYYLENGYKRIPHTMAYVQAQQSLMGKDIELLCEADTYPHCLYSQSSTTLRSFIAVSTLAAKTETPYTWMTSHFDWVREQWTTYADVMGRSVDFFRAVDEISKQVQWLGPSCVLLPDGCAERPWRPNYSEVVYDATWAANFCGRVGIPFTVNNDDSPVAMISADAAWAVSDGLLDRFLTKGLLLDGEAAKILCARGCGEKLGIMASNFDDSARCSLEIIDDLPFNGELSGWHFMVRCNFAKLEILDPNLTAISSFCKNRWFGDSEFSKVGPACIIGKTSAGGHIAVFAHDPKHYCFLDPIRRELMKKVMAYLSNDTTPWVNAKSDIYFLFGKTADPKRFIAAAFNLNQDTLEKLDIFMPGCSPTRIRMLDKTGRFRDVAFESVRNEKNRVCIDIKLPTIEPLVFDILTAEPHNDFD